MTRAGRIALLLALAGTWLVSGTARAAFNITSATVDGGASTTVAAGATVSVAATLNYSGNTSGANGDWGSTRWTLNGVSTCTDHADRSDPGPDSVTFNITAPAGAGSHDLTLKPYSSDSCSGQSGNDYVLSGAVVVAAGGASATLAARYRFEESSWNGTSGELNDDAGHADGPYDGRAYRSDRRGRYPSATSSSPALANDPGTCGYAGLSGSGYFRIDNIDALSTANNRATSTALWLYWDGGGDQAVLYWNSGYGLVFHDGKFGFTTFNRSGGRYDMRGVASSGLSAGWHHVVAVFVNGAPAANKLYIDGVLQTLAQSGSVDGDDDLVDDDLYVGADDEGDWRLAGRIDELHVYDGELDSTGVATLYAERHACASGCASQTGTSSISFVAANGPASVSSSTVSALSFAKPAGTVQNDVIVAQVAALTMTSSACVTVTAPAGWTQARSDVVVQGRGRRGSSCLRQSIYYKVAGASEAASYSFGLSGRAYATGGVAAYRGADTSAPVMITSGQTASGTGNITAPSVTTTRDGARLLGHFAVRDGDDETITPPACMTERVASATGSSSGITLLLADSPWGTAGATGNRVATVDDTDANIGQQVILQPAAAALTPGAYNAFDTGTAAGNITGNIQTKVAGTAFSLAVVALNAGRTALYGSGGNGFSGSVKVELLGTTATSAALDGNNCPAGATVLQTGTLAFAAGDGSRKNHAFTAVSDAWRNVRARFSYPATGTATTVACSTDNFAIRPASLASLTATDATWTTTGTARTLDNTAASGGVVHAAGQPFTLRATAVNSAGTTTGQYDGSPSATLTACPLPSGCAVDGSGSYTPGTFNVGTWAVGGGTVTSTDASYGDVGAITLQLVDDGFASVDAGDGSAASCAGRYVCSAETGIGRFVPDHFDLSLNDADGVPYPVPQLRTFGTTCATRSFTYVGQPFGYATPPKARVRALDAGGGVTANYEGFDAGSIKVTVSQDYGASTPVSPALDTSGIGAPTLVSNEDGTAEIEVPASAILKFTRGTTPVAPFNAGIHLAVDISDATENGVAGNGIIAAGASADFGAIGFDAGDQFRYGRLRFDNAYGVADRQLLMLARAYYWDGTRWALSAGDSCTALSEASGSLAFSNWTTFSAGATALANDPATLAGGAVRLTLSAPGAPGRVDVSPGGVLADYLPGTGTATFGVPSRSPVIHLRPNIR